MERDMNGHLVRDLQEVADRRDAQELAALVEQAIATGAAPRARRIDASDLTGGGHGAKTQWKRLVPRLRARLGNVNFRVTEPRARRKRAEAHRALPMASTEFS